MSASIDYYFTAASPFAYLGHDFLMEIAAKHGKEVNFKPFNIMAVWEKSGSVPPGQRSLTRQRYRLVEIERVALMRNIKAMAAPTNFPTDPTLADHCICALDLEGINPAPFTRAVGQALWEQDKQIADEATLKALLETCGHDAEQILTIAHSDQATERRAQNTSDAIEQDAIGAPAYVYAGEVFWGQDRLEYLDQMIGSGRDAIVADL